MTGASDLPMLPISPFQAYSFCRLVLHLKWSVYSLLFLAPVYLHSYVLASVYYHSIFFHKVFCQASVLFFLNYSMLTSTTTKALYDLSSSYFVKANFTIKHICILNLQTEKLWINSRHVFITMVFLQLFLRCISFIMLKVLTKILLELLT